jgi:hypothetical protein
MGTKMIGLDIDGVIIDFKKGFDLIVKILYPNNPIPVTISKCTPCLKAGALKLR